MANPSPAAIALIRDRALDWSDDDATIAASLNAPSLANPTPQPTIPKPLKTRDFMEALDVAGKIRIYDSRHLTRILDDLAKGDIETLENWVSMLLTNEVLTAEQATTIFNMLHATEPDPAWPEQISWAESVIGRLVDAEDIAASRPGDAI